MNLEIRTEAVQFPEKEYKNGIFVAVHAIPSSLLISSGGHNFVTPAANFSDLLEGLFHEISTFFKNKIPFKYFYLLMLFWTKKRLICRFLKISIWLDFVTKLILKTPKNVLENTNKEAS
jgi:hypothetical protein